MFSGGELLLLILRSKLLTTVYPSFKIALAHVAPIFLDRDATVSKACSLIEEAAKNGARLIAFPETFVPAFPIWAALDAPINNHSFFRCLAENSLRVPGPEIIKLANAARRAGILVSIGVNEISNVSVGCIWNANLLIGDDGSVLNHHRKLVPTFFEKMVWANGDGAGLNVVSTEIGKIGTLICGENTNPLARYSLMAQGEQVHISSYPPVWPTKPPESGENYNLSSAIRIRAGAHSFEAKCFNVVVSGFMDASMIEAIAKTNKKFEKILKNSPRGVSMLIGPTGEVTGETAESEETIIYNNVDLSQCVEPKQFHDVVGYYNRFDIFKLTVDRTANRPIKFVSFGDVDGKEDEIESEEPMRLEEISSRRGIS